MVIPPTPAQRAEMAAYIDATDPGLLDDLGVPRFRADDRCPRCDSPQLHLHPAVQCGGEVQPCPHPFHGHASR